MALLGFTSKNFKDLFFPITGKDKDINYSNTNQSSENIEGRIHQASKTISFNRPLELDAYW